MKDEQASKKTESRKKGQNVTRAIWFIARHDLPIFGRDWNRAANFADNALSLGPRQLVSARVRPECTNGY